jgi:hypothetical protein
MRCTFLRVLFSYSVLQQAASRLVPRDFFVFALWYHTLARSTTVWCPFLVFYMLSSNAMHTALIIVVCTRV